MEGRSIPLGGDYLDFTIYSRSACRRRSSLNYAEMTARGIAAAIATGNACVVKTPESTISTIWMARAAEAAGLPKGTVNILCGHGMKPGGAVAHPDIGNIVFTDRSRPASRWRQRRPPM